MERLCALLELLGIPADRLRFLQSTEAEPEAGPDKFALQVEASIKELGSRAAFWAGA